MRLYIIFAISLSMYMAGLQAQQAGISPNAHRSPESTSAALDARPIGTATMLRDRTIVLDLLSETGGALGHAQFTYKPGEPKYNFMLRHLSGMKPGDTKTVLPFNKKNIDVRSGKWTPLNFLIF